jgi:predicted nucleotidyltransferase
METKQDAVLREICDEIVAKVPAESIILLGSRATGQASAASDYDVAAVMKTALVPLYLRRLKKIEAELSQHLGTAVVINPLPTFRISRAKGNLFLYKLKREGVTLYGADFLGRLNPGDIADIGRDWYFSYLFSAMKELVEHFEPDEGQSNRLAQDTAKAILHCGEVYLLMRGYYESRSEEMLSRLAELYPQQANHLPALGDLELSLSIRKGNVAPDPLALWFRARGYLLTAFQALTQNRLMSIEELATEYLNNGSKPWLKNLQYFSLNLLLKRQLRRRGLITRCSVENRVRVALLWLLLSINEPGHIDRSLLARGYDALKGYAKINYRDDDIAFWRELRDSIVTTWDSACAVMGL